MAPTVASIFTKINPIDYHIRGSVSDLSQAPSKPKDARRPQGNAAVNSLTQTPTDEPVKVLIADEGSSCIVKGRHV